MLLVEENYINRSKNYRIGDSGLYEPWTENTGILFREYQREFGRCVSKVYIDSPTGPKQIGWVFQKREKYTDCNETYLQETWVTFHEDKPTKTVEYHYHNLN